MGPGIPTLVRSVPGGKKLWQQEAHGEIHVEAWSSSAKHPSLRLDRNNLQANDPLKADTPKIELPSPDTLIESARSDAQPPRKILKVCTSTKESKTASLNALADDVIQFKLGICPLDIEVMNIKTPLSEQKHGAQPYESNGPAANISRIEEAIDVILQTKGLQLSDFQAVLIMSIESFIDVTFDEAQNEIISYDRPSMVIYELFSGHGVSGVGRGPRVQDDLLEIAKAHGFLDADGPRLAGVYEYGRVVADVFGTEQDPIDSSDWHGLVCGQSRFSFLNELREDMMPTIRAKIESKEIDFNLF